jgi:hypothetical protein
MEDLKTVSLFRFRTLVVAETRSSNLHLEVSKTSTHNSHLSTSHSTLSRCFRVCNLRVSLQVTVVATINSDISLILPFPIMATWARKIIIIGSTRTTMATNITIIIGLML